MWFHISKQFLGNKALFKAKVPYSCRCSSNCANQEGDIPRICVTNTPLNCILAIMGVFNPSVSTIKDYFVVNPCVYYTEETPFLPPNCSDFRKSNEHWFLKDTTFRYLGRINMYKFMKNNVIVPTDEEEIRFPKGDFDLDVTKTESKFMQNILGLKR